MTQEERTLLIKDLCMRLPYGVMVECSIEQGESIDLVLSTSHIDELINNFLIVKPYLHPMSSMTKEETYDYDKICGFYGIHECEHVIDWLNKNMFDYRGLIEKGLALPAKKGMYI